jgi:cysteinyl-tRNA synthetase
MPSQSLPRFYNTLVHDFADFAPLAPGPDPADPINGSTIKIYSCGPTVYDFAHIGNFRAFLFADVLRRFLEFRGAKVRHVMNMTDVGHMVDDSAADGEGEDKVQKAVREALEAQAMEAAGQKPKTNKKRGAALVANPNDPYQVVQYFVDAFLEDARALQLKVALEREAAPADQKNNFMPRPTQFITPFIAMIEKLIAKKHAYVGEDGVVYYDVHSFADYGKLSGNSLEQLAHNEGGRQNLSAKKRHGADFFLWKPDAKHIMKWPSPWGAGYPGWHIECSAMATSILGDSIDIHTGGEDNIFPHHECEIAQSEGATGKPFSKFWMHNRHLMVDGAKMSKSKGTFYTIRDLVAKGYDPLAIRYALISARYRESINFSLQGLQESASAVGTLRDLAEKLAATTGPVDNPAITDAGDKKMLADFAAALNDDLNAAGALAAVFTWVAPLSKQKKFDAARATSALAALIKLDEVLAVIFPPLRPLDAELVAKVEALMKERLAARTAKDWAKSDALRNDLLALGVEVKDTPTGSIWRPRLAPASI